jgi:hypothetical protein
MALSLVASLLAQGAYLPVALLGQGPGAQLATGADLARQTYWCARLLGLWDVRLSPLSSSTADGSPLWLSLPPMPGLLSWGLVGSVLAGLVVASVTYGLLFYLNWRVLVPQLLARHRVGLYCLVAWLASCLVVLLRLLPAWWLPDGPGATLVRSHPVAAGLQAFAAAAGVVFVSFAIRLTSDYLRGERRRSELEKQQLLMELALLKARLQPHFLFNTLNNIYVLTRQRSAQAPEAVLRLAELMRYVLYESGADTVPLAREVGHLHSFVDLQRLRCNGNPHETIQFCISGDPQAHALPPMLLMSLVENAFKHGNLSADAPAVRIELRAAAEHLQFTVDNRLDVEGATIVPPGGVGLATLRRRLALAYPDRHDLHIAASPADYEVTLTLWPERAA